MKINYKQIIEWLKGWRNYYGLKRRRIADIKTPLGDWRWSGCFIFRQYEYKCSCGELLTFGPSGGASVNAVCEKCRINYGCLPGFDE